MKNYNIKSEIDALYKEYKNEKTIGVELWDTVKDQCPVNRGVLQQGRLYVFEYKKDTDKLYDMRPYILCFGACDPRDLTVVYGLAWHYVPQKIRWQLGEYIYGLFDDKISTEIDKHPEVSESDKQDYIAKCTKEIVVPALKKINLTGAIHKYDMRNMKNCYVLNYNMLHWVLCDETNSFTNGTIADAQKSFLSKMTLKPKR